MMLGIGGAGSVVGSPGAHNMLARNTCVTCHIGKDASHTFEPQLSSCLDCHQEAEDFDIGGVQTEVAVLIAELGELLEAKGMYHDGHPVVGTYPAAEAQALWNYIFILVEDGSLGVHNPGYTKALLEDSIAALKP
jgi:hypothetical protein